MSNEEQLNRLSNLDALEVSLVPKGANERKFLLFKSIEGRKTMSKDKKKQGESDEKVKKEDQELKKAEKTGGEVDKVATKKIDQRELAADLASVWGVTTGEALGFMAALNPEEPEDRRAVATVVSREYEGLSPVDVMEVLAEAEGSNPDHYEDKEGIDISEINKANLPDKVDGQVEELFKQYEEIRKENEEIKKQLAKEQEQKQIREFVAKAKEIENIAIDAEEFGVVLKEIADISKQSFETVMSTLKSADEMVAQNNLFAERGSSLEGSTSDSWSKIEKIAKAKMEEDSSLGKEQAINKVLKEKPELYREYQQERRRS